VIAPKDDVKAATAEAAPAKPKKKALTRRDFVAPLDVRWCPGCGDYAILNTLQNVFPTLGIPRENFCVISGIGCSSRFPYYMNTYGFHTIHGRAPSVATGVRVTNPDLSTWVVTGDGDGLSIGGNHLMHLLRRNLDVNVLLFNNRIYGLTKGQYSPTSQMGMRRKTTPMGSIDQPINPLCFALASEATFVARTYDRNPKHMAAVFKAAAAHRGTAFVEIMQNCVIFNDGAWDFATTRDVRSDNTIDLKDGEPLVFGKELDKGIVVDGGGPRVVELGADGVDADAVATHHQSEESDSHAYMLARMTHPEFPIPIGIFRNVERPTYEDMLNEQIHDAKEQKGPRNLQSLLIGSDYWEVREEDDAKVEMQSGEEAASTDSLADEMSIMEEQARETERHANDPLIGALSTTIDRLEVTYGTGRVITVERDATIEQSIALLKEYKLEALLVVSKGKLVGVVTSRDIFMKVVLTEVDRDASIKEIMTQRPEVAAEGSTVGDAISKLAIGRFRHLPVRHGTDQYSMLSAKDLLGYVFKYIDNP